MSGIELWAQNDDKMLLEAGKSKSKRIKKYKIYKISPYDPFVNENGLGATLKSKMFLGTKTHIIRNKA